MGFKGFLKFFYFQICIYQYNCKWPKLSTRNVVSNVIEAYNDDRLDRFEKCRMPNARKTRITLLNEKKKVFLMSGSVIILQIHHDNYRIFIAIDSY